MTCVKQYRNSHTDHHHHLGGKDDPDHGEGNLTSLRHYRVRLSAPHTYSRTDGAVQNCRFDHTSFWSLFAYDLLDARSFYQTAVGSAPDMSLGQLARFFAWWGTVSVLTGVLGEGRYLGLSFLLLWHAARLTVAHACFIFRELLDHSGLASTSVLSFTRTLPCCNLLQKFLQPHDDNYHLLHHLFPRVPMARAHEMHLWLLDNVEAYRETNRTSSDWHLSSFR
jgi:fatty acid desaturase